ncbi:hypothetical protein AeMF1_011353 [Aphanomyces euteiches]|nr:hypothetical protein AeMF1_011353 [Aphanomyces euteiches]
MLVGRFLSRTICNVVGYAYPIYMSVHAARKEDATEEHIQWVVFWTVNACFAVFEILVEFLGNYIPLYYEAKVCMIAWLALPRFRGASQIYDALVAPSFVKYEKTLDEHIDLASDKLSQLCRDAAALAVQKSAGAIVQGQQYLVMQAMQQAWKVPTSPTNARSEPKPAPVATEQIPTSAPTPAPAPVDVEPAKASTPDKLPAKVEQPPMPPPNPPVAPPEPLIEKPVTRHDKEAELLGHFRVLLSRGLKVRHQSKSRLLRLSPLGNYLYLESKTLRAAKAPVILSLLTIQVVESIGSSEVYLLVETHTEKVTLEAEAKKTRDLLVAGLRLLAVAFQKQAKRTLVRLAHVGAKYKQQVAFDMLVAHSNKQNKLH